jgi:hypothetical protein
MVNDPKGLVESSRASHLIIFEATNSIAHVWPRTSTGSD